MHFIIKNDDKFVNLRYSQYVNSNRPIMIYGNNFIRIIGHCIAEDWRWNTIYAHTAVLDFALLFPVSGNFPFVYDALNSICPGLKLIISSRPSNTAM